jgi:hypothetical protein
MTDTPSAIQQKQIEIILQKSPKERFMIGAELIDFGMKLLETQIRILNPAFSDIDVKVELFIRCYSNCYTGEELQRIIHYLKRRMNSATNKMVM